MNKIRMIGIEEHGWTAGIRDALNALPAERQDPSIAFFNIGETDERLRDFGERRLREMAEMGMDMQILSVTTPGTQILAPADAVRLAREANDVLADAVKLHPDRFAALATLPTPDPAAAVVELRRAVEELGMKGAMIHGRTGSKMLDHPDFAPILDEAARLDVPIFIHPQMPPKAVREAYYDGLADDVSFVLASGMWGWHMETAINAIRLILSGTFDRLPNLQIVLGHWGEMIPLYLERVSAAASLAKGLKRTPADYFREHFYIAPSGIWSWQMLTHALAEVGADRIVFAIDYPFQHPLKGEARAFLENAPIAEDDKHKIGYRNLERLLKLSSQST